MAWILQDDNDKAIISEIQQQTDRGVMIIGASLLEGRLMQSIQLRMMPDMPTDMGGAYVQGFRPTGKLLRQDRYWFSAAIVS